MKWIATECAWFSAFFEKPLLILANLFIDMCMVRFCRSTEGTGFEIPVPCHPQWSRGSPRSAIRAEETGCIGVRSDSLQEGTGFELPVPRYRRWSRGSPEPPTLLRGRPRHQPIELRSRAGARVSELAVDEAGTLPINKRTPF